MKQAPLHALEVRQNANDNLLVLGKRVRYLQQDIPTPCIGVCSIDPSVQLCVGCYRTLEEIAAWGSSDTAKKKTVWQQLVQRMQATPSEAIGTQMHTKNQETDI